MSKNVAIVVNGMEPPNLYPPFILGTSAQVYDADVTLFFCPAAAPALKKGHLEGIKGKGVPEMAKLVQDFTELGGKILLCVLALEAKDLKPEDLRDGVQIVSAPEFMEKALDCTCTFSF
jgi:predicted peroxiredoxin